MTKEELKIHIETRYLECSKRSQGLCYGSFYDGYMDCYTEFEKELAKRTEQIETLNKDKNCFSDALDKQVEATLNLQKEYEELKNLMRSEHELEARKNNRLISQLTTAKELLKWWVNHCGNHDLYYAKETEQFLKDEGCPDCFCEDCTKEDCGIKKLGLVEVEK